METNNRPASARDELRSVLWAADSPLSLGQICARLSLPYRFVSYTLIQAVGAGHIERTDDGRYILSIGCERAGVCLQELFDFVLACEAEWRLDDRLAALDRYGIRNESDRAISIGS
jgi:hypothetical protein